MATQKWIAGSVGLAWPTTVFGTELNSLANGNAVLSSVDVDNSANLDVFCDLSASFGSLAVGAGAPYVGVYLYPLNQDGSTYGDSEFGSAAAGPPPSAYYVGSIPLIPSVTGVNVGMLRGIVMPPGHFKFVFYNQAGVALAASANTVKIRTYDFAVN
jgi:hypothetical protein